MYFSLIPDIKYDQKPISYPFSESDFVIAKNFFRRYQANPDIFEYSTYYKKYTVEEGERLENVAQKAYGNAFYDWVVILINNIVDPLFAFPLDSYTLRQVVEEKYGSTEAYSGIHHYETKQVITDQVVDRIPVVALDEGLVVDENFYNSTFTYWNGDQYLTVAGNTVSTPVSNYDHEVSENEKKREIFILRQAYLRKFVEEFKTRSIYGESSDYISKKLKKVAV